MSRDQIAVQSPNIKIYNSSFQRVKEFKYFGTTLMHQYSTQEEIKRRLKSENASIVRHRTLCLPICYPKI